MSVALGPIVKYHLQQHLVNLHHIDKALPLHLGTTQQLETAVKISNNDKVSSCFRYDKTPESYPKLPNRSSLVACIDRFLDVQVYAIYSLSQMKEVEAQRTSPMVKIIHWKVLEISVELEQALLEGVNLKEGTIITSMEVFHKL